MKPFLDGLRNRHSLRLTERLSPTEKVLGNALTFVSETPP